jgi:hypothetical protein
MLYSGQEHNSPKDKVDRVSGKVFKDSTRVTSVQHTLMGG